MIEQRKERGMCQRGNNSTKKPKTLQLVPKLKCKLVKQNGFHTKLLKIQMNQNFKKNQKTYKD